MSLSKTIRARRSTRAFLAKPVEKRMVDEILDLARWSPSGGNLQPWRIDVVMGEARNRLVEKVTKAIANDPLADESEIDIYPPKLWDPYRTRRYQMGEAMYEILGIARDDKMSRMAHLARNYQFFGAPVGLFFSLDRRFDKGQWAHLGMIMQTLCLGAEEKGLATCMQEAWSIRAKLVTEFLGLPEEQQLYCGIALGFADPHARVNQLRTERAPVEEFVHYHE